MLTGAGVVTYAVASVPAQPRGHGRMPPSVQTLRLTDQGEGGTGLPQWDTDRFSAALLTWDDPHAALGGTAELRSRSAATGEWSDWQRLPAGPFSADGAEARRPGLRGGTASVWTGAADGVEVRVVSRAGTPATGLPAGLDVKLLDPGMGTEGVSPTEDVPAAGHVPGSKGVHGSAGVSGSASTSATGPGTATGPVPGGGSGPGDGTVPGAGAAPGVPGTEGTPKSEGTPGTGSAPGHEDVSAPAAGTVPGGGVGAGAGVGAGGVSRVVPAVRPSTVARPAVVARGQWGAWAGDGGTPRYGAEVGAAFVHDTGAASDNELSCAESRARLRTLQQAYLVRGYDDIGDNFVVDRCGQVFEGRGGGMDLPVVGAHERGSNAGTVGISFIGDFAFAKMSPAAREAVARIVAWKFGMYGIDPAGRVMLSDGGEAARIAESAGTPGISHAPPTSDFNRDGTGDLAAGTPRASGGAGAVTVIPGGLDGPAAASKVTITQDSPGVPGSSAPGDNFGAATAWGDVNGDGCADLAIGVPGKDDGRGHAEQGAVTVLYGPGLDSGVSYTAHGVAPAGARLGSAIAVGDFDGDGRADVFAAGTGHGGTWNVWLSGGATASGHLTTATGPVSHPYATAGDFNGDGYADVALNYTDPGGTGRVVWFAGSAHGLTWRGVLPVRGGRQVAAGDIDGDGYDDLVIGQPYARESGGAAGGQVTMVRGAATGLTTTGMKVVHQDGVGVAGGNLAGDGFGAAVAVGDHDADGYADVLVGAPGEGLTRDGVHHPGAGQATLLRGTANGLTATGSFTLNQETPGILDAAETGDRFGSSVALTDMTGHGRAGLVFGAEGEDAGDGLLLYTPVNATGFGLARTVALRSSALGTPAGARLGQNLAP
ncbi:FG-GAP-like repeat-containing protein [Streptomyces sp. NPDC014889]|uniref:FG-GAP-like repeat-containing protein n=1 Tax=Streptomyces sp. NPDC014889 TaxID=3364928 RepID=UPI0036F65304